MVRWNPSRHLRRSHRQAHSRRSRPVLRMDRQDRSVPLVPEFPVRPEVRSRPGFLPVPSHPSRRLGLRFPAVLWLQLCRWGRKDRTVPARCWLALWPRQGLKDRQRQWDLDRRLALADLIRPQDRTALKHRQGQSRLQAQLRREGRGHRQDRKVRLDREGRWDRLAPMDRESADRSRPVPRTRIAVTSGRPKVSGRVAGRW
jgi:hypothetical protein